MIVTRRFYVFYGDDRYKLCSPGKAYELLRKLYDNSNRRMFMCCCQRVIFDDLYYELIEGLNYDDAEAKSVGSTCGTELYIQYDNLIEKPVMKILKECGLV